MTEADLIRFVNAQAEVYSQVIEELTDGCKRTHWMWFIFPQLAGLGHSAMAQRYAIHDLDQAKRYPTTRLARRASAQSPRATHSVPRPQPRPVRTRFVTRSRPLAQARESVGLAPITALLGG